MNPVETPVQTAVNPLKQLHAAGQSIWLDYIRRDLMSSGKLKRMIDEDGLCGMTSNPAIFEKAITGSDEYKSELETLRGKGLTTMQVYEALAIRDIQTAADALKPVFDATRGADGFVSLEVSPYLARDTKRTIAEALRLWKEVHRPNLMIKVPATKEGLPAIEELIFQGLNVNVTLIFSNDVYKKVAEAFIKGLERRQKKDLSVSGIASVASFFVSRIDTAVDALLAKKIEAAKSPKAKQALESLLGRAAIANAKLAYQIYKGIIGGARWKKLAAKGARPQRLLWASTSTKNPKYRDVMYVEDLIGRDTVNTVPPQTLDAFREHGRVANTLEEDVVVAKRTLSDLKKAGISIKAVTDQVLTDGVKLFVDPFDKLLQSIDPLCKLPKPEALNPQSLVIADDLRRKIDAALGDWKLAGKVPRLWSRDASLWTQTDEARWLGWLRIVERQRARVDDLKAFQQDVREGGFTHALLLGMGGSSLCPEVLRKTFGGTEGFPELLVLDSTDPAQIRSFEERIELGKTLFIVSSKSGTTLEPNILQAYFWDLAAKALGAAEAGKHFVAVTDPGSQLEKHAQELGFRHIFHGEPSIGGRYSALSDFGLVAAAALGLDLEKLLDRTLQMVAACSACLPIEQNPGAQLGLLLGLAAKAGRNKLTILTSPGLADLGAWLEQLLAESTGKDGKAIIPVDREPLGPAKIYGKDRVFAAIHLAGDPAIPAVSGAPCVRIELADRYDIGQEFFRWEIATAVAGAVMGINPFNQPDVEASKIETRKLTDAYERDGSLPSEKPIFEDRTARLFADKKNAKALGRKKDLAAYLKGHVGRLKAGDYFAVLAYLPMTEAHERRLGELRLAVREKKRVATCLGFGPRFLHSTGQAYKGGPNSGVFLQLTCDDAHDLTVPGRKFSFGVVKAAQARGDLEVLSQRRRRALRVHLGADVEAGLAGLTGALKRALG